MQMRVPPILQGHHAQRPVCGQRHPVGASFLKFKIVSDTP